MYVCGVSVTNGSGHHSILWDRLQAVIARADPRLGRVSSAGTSVSFTVRGAPTAPVTLLLDRDPPQLVAGEEPAEIAIELDHHQAEQFARGELSLPPRLLEGRVAYRGPVRKYMIVDPVLRALLADH